MERGWPRPGPGRVPIGVIGGGLVAQAVHLPLLQRLDAHFRLAALAEPDAGARERLAARHGIGAAHADHHALLAAGGVDAVLVCSPDATHARVVCDALDAGLHVLVEKPLCLTPEDGVRIVEARDRAGTVVEVGYMKRFDPAVEALLADLPGAPPPVHIATATFDPGLREAFGPPGLAPGVAGAQPTRGAFLGALVHDVNLVHAVLDRCGLRVERVIDGYGADDGSRAGGAVELAGGARWTAVWLALPGAGTFREQLTLYGDDGVRELEFPAPYVLGAPTTYRHVQAGGAGSITTTRSSWREAYERQLLHFHAAITAGAPGRNPPEAALADIRLLTALLEHNADHITCVEAAHRA